MNARADFYPLLSSCLQEAILYGALPPCNFRFGPSPKMCIFMGERYRCHSHVAGEVQCLHSVVTVRNEEDGWYSTVLCTYSCLIVHAVPLSTCTKMQVQICLINVTDHLFREYHSLLLLISSPNQGSQMTSCASLKETNELADDPVMVISACIAAS